MLGKDWHRYSIVSRARSCSQLWITAHFPWPFWIIHIVLPWYRGAEVRQRPLHVKLKSTRNKKSHDLTRPLLFSTHFVESVQSLMRQRTVSRDNFSFWFVQEFTLSAVKCVLVTSNKAFYYFQLPLWNTMFPLSSWKPSCVFMFYLSCVRFLSMWHCSPVSIGKTRTAFTAKPLIIMSTVNILHS